MATPGTVLLGTEGPDRLVGGRLQAGDTVGVFASFDGDTVGTTGHPNVTHLTIHKMLVTSVQGALAAVEDPDAPAEESATPAVPAEVSGRPRSGGCAGRGRARRTGSPARPAR